MTEHTPEKVADLIGEARAGDFEDRGWMIDVIDRMADALEAVSAEVERLHAVMGRGFIKVLSDRDEAYREMHARELHHFEEEQARAKAEAERDEAREVIADIRREVKDFSQSDYDALVAIEHRLSRTPEQPKGDQ